MKTEHIKLNLDYNRLQLINTDTNKVIGNALLKTDGSEEVFIDVTNKNRIEGYKKKSKEIQEISEFIQSNEGNFIHSLYRYCYPYMLELQSLDVGSKNNIHIVRFIVLCTYLSKDGYVRFESRKITRKKLYKLWDLKDSKQSKKTYEKLKEVNYIYEDEEGCIMINQDIVINGKVKRFKKLKKLDEKYTYSRLFSKNIQDMYYNCADRKRKLLGNLFKILPFINFKHNVFCANPQELDEKELQLLKWSDLARICGYNDTKQITRFKKDMLNLELYEGVSTLGMFVGANARQMICVNPKIYYGGNDIKDVNHLYALFKMIDTNNSTKKIN